MITLADPVACYVKRAEISAVVTRADGRVEDMGVIASYERKSVRSRIARLLGGNR